MTFNFTSELIQPFGFVQSFGLIQSLLIAVLISVIIITMPFFGSNHFKPEGKHCYVAGASQGLGAALACKLAKMGAHVTIVARSKDKLEKTLQEVEKNRQSPSQIFQSITADLSTSPAASQALNKASKPFNDKAPDFVFCTAGISYPKFFVDQTTEELQSQMDINYFTALWTAHAAVSQMVKQGVKGKIVFTSSVVGLVTFAGYSGYSPSKFALRGLADSLRNELNLYGISIHCFFPATIKGPAYDLEKTMVPELTKKIEGPDSGMEPEEWAEGLVKGLQSNRYYITYDLVGDLFRSSQGGLTPKNNVLWDSLLGFVGMIAFPIWRWIIDNDAKNEGKKIRRS